ncbi:hemopexin [Dromiciops gliroides]|uniref:hemopexin n=1 Tax=Dromiciops gliroides TaxID=33562 RepID=UPI001CC449AC|nr:hemopexin [Dromiciops gliroides]
MTRALGILIVLGLYWALALAHPLVSQLQTGTEVGNGTELHPDEIGRCSEDWGFDAVTLDDSGNMIFFKGESVWKNHNGSRELISETWPEVGFPVDAAFRLHHKTRPELHDGVYLIKGDQVWLYIAGKLKTGYPRLLQKEFPGVPSPLDATVECHPGECQEEGILFFQGNGTWFLDLSTGKVKKRPWHNLNCSSALRWLGRYYCFQGSQFLRFDPARGEVPPHYPRDVRDYFMSCPGRGHGRRNGSVTPCSPDVVFSAFVSDDHGAMYGFKGSHYWRLDSRRDGWHSWPIAHHWPQGPSSVDAAFSWEKKLYLIEGTQIYIFLTDGGNRLVEGYPRKLQKELGSPYGINLDTVDAAFTCPGSSQLYIISGRVMWQLDLKLGGQDPWTEFLIPHNHVDGALCRPNELYLISGSNAYRYRDVEELKSAKTSPPPRSVASSFLGCRQ